MFYVAADAVPAAGGNILTAAGIGYLLMCRDELAGRKHPLPDDPGFAALFGRHRTRASHPTAFS